MATITHRHLADAVLRVAGMSFEERDRLADEVYSRQPNLFASVIVLHRYGATHVQMDVVLNILLVFDEAMRISSSSGSSGRSSSNSSNARSGASQWPVISEDVQELSLRRISARVRFTEGLSPQLQQQAITDAIADHPEQLLLAYVFGKFGESDLLDVKTEAEKMLVLASLNLVECIAETAPRNPT